MDFLEIPKALGYILTIVYCNYTIKLLSTTCPEFRSEELELTYKSQITYNKLFIGVVQRVYISIHSIE